ncbi:MAG: PAS domain S-box protein [Desulfobacteraceae bacterium]|nr:PAS domain S-box protein [Desulfobacteraceae bacterium]
MKFRQYMANQPIRNKLFISYFGIFLIALGIGSLIFYVLVRNIITKSIESELKSSTTTILNMVQTAASVSLKNYLRAAVEKNREIVEHFYRRFEMGQLSEQQAKNLASETLLSQKIGTSGYIYCMDSQGVLRVHPQKTLLGVNISHYDFVKKQKRRKQGYLEYNWQNPGEQVKRPKALQMTYFQPWDWIISASSYRKEFNQLVNVDDFRDSILSLRFGRTGYSYVINTKGTLVIHPKLEGVNIIDEIDASGRKFIQVVCRKRSGKIVYPWKNPGDNTMRDKLVIFNYIPELEWIVASSSYLEEFYAPMDSIRELMMTGLILSLALFMAITFRINESITNPIKELKDKFNSGATADFSVRMTRQANDELGQLASYFNSFMEKLEAYSADLKKEIKERQQAEIALRCSEEMFSKAFRLSPNAIFIVNLKSMRIINANDSLLKTTGYEYDEFVGSSLTKIRLFSSSEEVQLLMRSIEKHRSIRGQTVEFLTLANQVRKGFLSAEIIELWGEPCVLASIDDVTEMLRLEKEIMDISEKERLRIGQDLHDDLCPHLIGVEVLTKVLRDKLEEKIIEEADMAEKIRHLTMEAIRKTRMLTHGLCPVNLDIHGLKSSLQELVQNVSDVFNVNCVLDLTCPVIFHDNAIATHLYYITHEAVHNAVKHGQAEKITVSITKSDGRYCVVIHDNGIGIKQMERPKGIGLRIMELRAKKINADFSIHSEANNGTTVNVKFWKRLNSTQEECSADIR